MSLQISFDNITQFLNQSDVSDEKLLNELFEFLYTKIKSLADSQLRKLNPDNSLTPTQLVNECYIKIRSAKNISLKDRNHFYSLAARCMRFFLVDLVRQSYSQKNDGITTDLKISQIVTNEGINLKLLELDRCLEQLFEIDETLATITELKFFGGFTFEEIAEIINQPKSTVFKNWTMAKSYLINLIAEQQESP